jgi:hypothetical protein
VARTGGAFLACYSCDTFADPPSWDLVKEQRSTASSQHVPPIRGEGRGWHPAVQTRPSGDDTQAVRPSS